MGNSSQFNIKNFFRYLFGEGQKENANQPAVGVPQPDPSHHVQHQREEELYKAGDMIGGKYEVHHRLGKGGFGVVYLVYDRRTHLVCALKTFRDEFLADSSAREDFKKETLLWVNLDEHPFILAARFVEEFSGRLFVAMDYIAPDQRGCVSLEDHLLRSRGPLDINQTLEWVIQFCYGMEHANTHGIKVHRDIKPGNILITQDGTLKITDFGLAAGAVAALRGGGSLVSISEDGRPGFSLVQAKDKGWCGTLGYIAPEVYEGKESDVRSDIYSFGAVLWQMAAGNLFPPFYINLPRCEGEDDRAYVVRYAQEIYRRQTTEDVPKVDGPLYPVTRRCLCRETSGRYSDFGKLRGEMEVIYRSRTGRRVELPPVGEKTATFWSNKGISLHSLGRYQEAIYCLDKALEIDPRNAAGWNNKGISLHSLGRYQEAIYCLDKALEIDPRNAAAWNNKGNSLKALGRHQEAIYCYDKALEIDPRDAPPWSNKGGTLNSLCRYQEAIYYLDKALEIDPRDADAWNNKGISLYSLGRYQEAISCCDKALKIDPRYIPAWNNKGNSLDSLGRHQEAIYCLDKAIEIDPRDANAWYNKGLSLHSLGRYQEAIYYYDKALEIDPRYANAWNNKGYSLYSLGRYQEAISCCGKALEIDPRCAPAWNNKGNSLHSLGRYQEEIYCYDKALEIAPRYAVAWYNKGNSLRSLGRYQEAIYCYDKALEIDPRDAQTWNNKGACLGSLGRYQEAIVCFDKNLEINPRDAVVWFNKALAEDKIGNFRDAARSYRKFIELAPPQFADQIAHARQRLKELQ
jgi:tetratricopeptide (TPR) repeat protein